MTLGQLGIEHPSLGGMLEAIMAKLTRQGLHYKFSKLSVIFMEKCLNFVFKQKIEQASEIDEKLLKQFSRVLIWDSSSWDVSASLKDVFCGTGGSASEANCKIQIGYEYKKGGLNFYQVTQGTVPDQAFSKRIAPYMQARDLLLSDLGYFSLKTFKEIDQKGAYFISRYLQSTDLWASDSGSKIELDKILPRISGNIYFQDVIVGYVPKTQVHCRLICLRVP